MENGTACLSDFGLSGVVSDFFGSSTFSSTISGNIRWGAPELFALPENQDGSINRPSKEADVYSFGSIMLQVRIVLCIAAYWSISLCQVLSGKVPYYYIKQQMQIIMMVVNGKKPRRPEEPTITEEHWSMIERCWSPCDARPTIEDILIFIAAQRSKHKIWLVERMSVTEVGLQNTCEQLGTRQITLDTPIMPVLSLSNTSLRSLSTNSTC